MARKFISGRHEHFGADPVLIPNCMNATAWPRSTSLRRAFPALLLLAWALLFPGSARAAGSDGAVVRVAVLVAANDGGASRATLRYTESDAHSLSKVLREVGGLEPINEIQVYRATPRRIQQALDRARKRAREAQRQDRRVEFIFYYSGHSDERGLLLGKERVAYQDLRNAVDEVPADVHIAILDSCASGAFTRIKGGKRRPPFLFGSSTEVRGHAFLTSSSAEETAQESDQIGGSFFTHFLTSGLRGAADRDNDRIVTLAEAYQFAFDETLAHTQAASEGAQHAAYDIKLSGSGELVMTDLRRATGHLVIDGDIEGRVWIRGRHGRLAAEVVATQKDVPISLALEPGRYSVTVDAGRRLLGATVEVSSSGRARVTQAQLKPVPRTKATARGGAASDDYIRIPFAIGFFPALSIGDKQRPRIVSSSFYMLWGHAARLHGVAMSLGADIVSEEVRGAQFTVAASVVRGRLSGAQFTSGMNWVSEYAKGGQFSALANVAREVHGVQLTSGLNWSSSMRGAQLGLANVAGQDLRGAQLGLVNVGGKVRGAQIGLINVAKSADASIGLLSVTKEGGVHPEVWTSDTAAFNVGLRFPARYTYSFVAAGFHPAGSGAGWMFGLGFGGHIPIRGPASIDIDVGGYSVFIDRAFDTKLSNLAKARLMFAWSFARRLTLWGGPTFNFAQTDPTSDEGRLGYGYASWRRTNGSGDNRIQLWPGFVAGLRF